MLIKHIENIKHSHLDAIVGIEKKSYNYPWIREHFDSDINHLCSINYAYIKDDEFKIYIDSSGRPLFMRGYRSRIHKASLNECLAAGIVLLSNWDLKSSFYDPMCGSGTIPIEAAMIAFNIPPNILRERFAFQLWDDYDIRLWKKILSNSRGKIKIDDSIKILENLSLYMNKLLQQTPS